MPKHKSSYQGPKKTLDPFSEKRGEDVPRNCRYSEILGRAEASRGIFTSIWQRLSEPLLAGRTEEEVIEAFRCLANPTRTNSYLG